MTNRARRQIRDEQLDRFDRDLRLCLFRARAQVRRANDARQAEQRAIGARLRRVNIKCHAADLPSLQSLGERRFVVNAAAGRIDQPHAALHLFDLRRAQRARAFRR